MSYRKNFVGTQKRVRISNGKRAIGVRAIEVRLWLVLLHVINFVLLENTNRDKGPAMRSEILFQRDDPRTFFWRRGSFKMHVDLLTHKHMCTLLLKHVMICLIRRRNKQLWNYFINYFVTQ